MFATTGGIALSVYAETLAPQVTFGLSGVFATAAMYPGPSVPSGHPLWALVGWAWIKVLPFGNIAWRLALGSAIAAAISSGLIAVIVSKIGRSISRDERLGTVGGIVAGLGFAFEKGSWSKAVVVDSWSLSMLLLVLVLYSVSCWFFESARRRWLYGAAFLAGIGLCESQALAPTIYVLPLVVALADVKLGRDLFLMEAVMLWSWLAGKDWLLDVGWNVVAVWRWVMALAIATTAAWVVCWWRARKADRSRQGGAWRSHARSLACVALFAAGLSFCFLLPVFSMTNPPMNWGYPRTEEGFAHVLSRGQFDSFAPTPSIFDLWARLWEYAVDLLFNVGPMYLIAATTTLLLWRRAPADVRKWMGGMWVAWIGVSAITVGVLNVERPEIANVRALFGPANAGLMVLAGCGVLLVSSSTIRSGEAENSTGKFRDGGQFE